MDNGKPKERILPPNNVIKTLMKVSQLHSSSSSLSSQSNYSSCVNNEDISYQKLQHISRKLPIKNFKKLSRVNEKKLSVARKKLHEKLLQLEWNNYIQWRILLTFSLGLWILLCITDKILLRSSALAKEGKITRVPPSNPETINFNLSNENKFSKWFSAFYSSISHAASFVSNSTDTYIFALFIGIFIGMEKKLKKKWKNTRENWTQYCDDSKFNLNDSNGNELSIKLLDKQCQQVKKNYNSDGKFSIKNLEFKQLIIDPDLYWQLKILDNSSEIKYIKNTDNYLKQVEVMNQVKEVDTSIYHLNKFDEKKICYCDKESFVETYDLEISNFINYEKKPVTLDKSTDTKLDRPSRIKYKKKSILRLKNISRRPSKNKLKNDRLNNKFISSSPAFKKFLLKLNDTNPFDPILNL
ncbi:hypothetical protein KQX54_008731 [Cotesia glomerata]|uniref:Uncharacterized protein n=1 Tax=Cotesia glomerata TaxID=32391 RepID=A0AAV7J582_COTGL|nr:hypothetical protein KQX54_008731 [Cotesia glomerata]